MNNTGNAEDFRDTKKCRIMRLALKPLQRSHSFDLSTSPNTPMHMENFKFKIKDSNATRITHCLLPVSSLPSNARTSSHNNLQAKCNNAKSKYNMRSSFVQGSLEGLNQELASLSVESNSYCDHKSDLIPDGHRAPVNELLYLFRDSPNCNNATHNNNNNNINNNNNLNDNNLNITNVNDNNVNNNNNNVTIDSNNNNNNIESNNNNIESNNNINNKNETNDNSNKFGSKLKANKDKRCCDLNLTATMISYVVSDHEVHEARDLEDLNEADKPTNNKDKYTKKDLKSVPSSLSSPHPSSLSSPLPPSLLSPSLPSLSSPLPPLNHLPFNYPTLAQPINKSNMATLETKDFKMSTNNNNDSQVSTIDKTSKGHVLNNNNDKNNNVNSYNKISNRQLLIPSNQSAFTSVSKVTHHHANHPTMAMTRIN